VLAKGVFPMDHPQHLGIYVGPRSHPAIRKRVRTADLVLELGFEHTDLNLGASRSEIAPQRCVSARGGRVAISLHEYDGVMLRDFVAALAESRFPRHRENVVYRDNLRLPKPRASRSSPLSVNDLLVELNRFLATHHDYHVVAESGDMLFAGLEARIPGRGLYFAQGYYASMGFAVPAALGAEIATKRRAVVLCGDGGFQMTGPEVSHAPKLGLAPIVLLVNNGGWGIFRPVTERHDLLAIPNWPYAELAQAWGGFGAVATHARELEEALLAAHHLHTFSLIECRVRPGDLSPLGRRYIRRSAAR
jgi:indolepyruvate decarboxylase